MSGFIVPDETGWRIGGLLAWLHVAVGDIVTAYLIHRERGYVGAVELIGENYEGFLIHDGWTAYESFIYAVHQTCLGHLLRRSKELEESAKGIAARFPRQIKEVLKAALAVRDQRDAGLITPAQAIEQASALSRQIIDLIAPPKTNAENERFAKHLWRLQDYLLTFLQFTGVDATNHKAEQAVRPSTANRKSMGRKPNRRGWQSAVDTVVDSPDGKTSRCRPDDFHHRHPQSDHRLRTTTHSRYRLKWRASFDGESSKIRWVSETTPPRRLRGAVNNYTHNRSGGRSPPNVARSHAGVD